MSALVLFLTVWAFATLSSHQAEVLGLSQLRIVVFSAVVAALGLLGLIAHPRLGARGRGLALVLLALHWLQTVVHPLAPFDPLGHKVLLVLLVLLLAPNVAAALGEVDVARVLAGFLAVYVLAAGGLALWGDPELRGYGAVARLDVSGSIVSQGSLCALAALVAAERAVRAPRLRLLWLPLLAAALVMVFVTATRTAVLAVLLFALYDTLAGPARVRLRLHLLAAVPAVLVFVLFTLTVNDVLWRRITGEGVSDWSSGRAHSLRYWISLAADHPLGLGIGTLRRMFADGRPVIDGGLQLEWPHDEFVRMWVEGGLPGLVFALLLVAGVVVRAVGAARATDDPLRRVVLLALAADLTAQSLLQNYFHSIYLATATVLTLAVLAVQVRKEAEEGPRRAAAEPSPAPHIPGRSFAGNAA